ncbi:protein kinase [Streptomyces sp. NBC_01762]|uniref:protein kinase n=1 Tax=unclassified Streptomyces TaxID=2593676 RepID=UPI002DD7D938|nr:MULTISPECIES: protein kinase [unclassified Streptomyces]WSC46865.1 protein kinase [Streptomyces sp. NBC_01762]WSD26517.1 protein kinase [Streptomyces sp. NBC_01751]WSJ51553.1 protein kinase [Streptomyces sp. NBC_01318]
MDDYAGRVLADRYRLPLPPSDEYELVETRAFDTASGQEVLVRQLPLPEVVDAEVLDAAGLPSAARRTTGRAVRRSTDPAVRRAIEAAQAAAQVPDHPRLDQVFDVFAEDGSLWIVSELVAARPLAALLAERPLNPYRAAEIGSDVLMALRVLHAHGWTHRNITVRTVLICDDGRVVLTGLAAGAAEEALCGYVPTPQPDDEDAYGRPAVESGPTGPYVPPTASLPSAGPVGIAGPGEVIDHPVESVDPVGLPASRHPAGELEAVRRPPNPDVHGAGSAAELRAARAGAIAAYRAGARAAARVSEDRRQAGTSEPAEAEESGILPVQRPGQPDTGRVQPTGGWGPTADDPYDDEGDEEDDNGYGVPYGSDRGDDGDGGHRGKGPPGRRMHLTGTWGDGADFGRPVPAGGSNEDALRADARRHGTTSAAERGHQQPRQGASGRWDDIVAGDRGSSAYRGPATPLAAERARQTRIAVVGAVTERWAPEQAGPVHENWQLAPPIGPATDLWALGALLYRAVQGHAPYPEENAAELVQMVCGEPPAFAEECGPLRPVVESLLRQDPTERPDFEELRGWLRSLVRSAPEPEAGLDVVPLPSVDDTRLPVVRRRGELVRKRRGRLGSASAHGRHRQTRERPDRYERPRVERAPRAPREPKGPKALRTPPRPQQGDGRAPRRLGRLLLVLILLALAAAIAYAVMFMPKAGTGSDSKGSAPAATDTGAPGTSDGKSPSQPPRSSPSPGSQKPQTSRSAVALAPGYTLRKDKEGFEVGVLKGWQRSPADADRQIRYGSDGFSLLVVPGRDTVRANGDDPLVYQRDKERELQPFRDSSWSSATGLRRIDVGRQAMAEGQFTWQDDTGREVYVRNLAMIVDGRYHVLQVIGPDSERDKVTAIYEQAIASYRVTS